MIYQVFRGGTVCRALQSCDKLKPLCPTHIITRPISNSTGSSGYSRRFSSTVLLACGAIAGAVGAEVFLWGYKFRNATHLTEAACTQEDNRITRDERQSNLGRELLPSAKTADPWNVVAKDDHYEARLAEAIAKSCDLMHRFKDENGAPGVVASVSVNGRCLWSEGLGYSDLENRVPCTPSTVHRIASISKSFTMVAVAKLMEEGKLDIDKVVQDYVPKFPEKTWKGEKVEITTRQLLSHMSGVRHYSRDYIKSNNHQKSTTKQDKNESNLETKSKITTESTGKKKSDETSNKSDSKMTDAEKRGDESLKEFYVAGNCDSVVKALDIFKDDPLVHSPGSKFLYTTYGWTLISAVVESAGGKPFLKQMADIFRDLDMMHTVPDEHIPIIYNRARGYSYNKCGRLVNTPHVNLSLKWAGGGFLSTVDDLLKFGNAMLYSYQYDMQHKENSLPPGYLTPETMATIWKPVPGTNCAWDKESKYAMGWSVMEREQTHGQCRKSRHLVSHTGGAVGFSSVLLIAPSTKDDVTGNHDNGQSVTIDNPPNGVVVAMISNLGSTSLYKTAVKIADIFEKL